MKKIIFYSWQSDLPNPTNRNFIQQALEDAVNNIINDDTIAVEPVVDRDTKGMAGAPDIASTIFAKISASDIFIADISIIARPEKGRSTPNPNVLIELGYALKSLGHERIILVFNNFFGKIEELPFDLRTRRLMTYKMSPEEKDKKTERPKLKKQLEEAIRSALEKIADLKKDTGISPSITAIENNQTNKVIVIRKNFNEILKRIDDIQPKPHSENGTVDDLIKSINLTQELVVGFSKIVEVASIMNDQEIIIEIYKWFGNIFERYDYPLGKDGKISDADHDYFRFLGHEMFVMVFAFLIREKRWEIIKTILEEPITIRYLRHENGPGNVYWDYASEYVYLLGDEGKKNQRVSMHADILNIRHSSGGLSTIVPMEEFSATDFFLFLYGEFPKTEEEYPYLTWRPWSVIYMKYIPLFLKDAEQKLYAQKLAKVFNLSDIEEFKKHFKEKYLTANRLFSTHISHFPISDKDIDKIGTR